MPPRLKVQRRHGGMFYPIARSHDSHKGPTVRSVGIFILPKRFVSRAGTFGTATTSSWRDRGARASCNYHPVLTAKSRLLLDVATLEKRHKQWNGVVDKRPQSIPQYLMPDGSTETLPTPFGPAKPRFEK